ncbi:MAG: DUF4835 family protein [Sphingobacteriales bacterium]|nr:DUF4835 family protein [Sphingobacteriales bacterium]
MNLRITGCVLLLFAVIIQANAQELNANVTVVSSQIQSTDKHIFDNMREGINEFLRNTTWTTYKFQPVEKIECNFYITIDEVLGVDKFKGKLQIQSVRPIYNSSYNSPLINIQDQDFTFEYIEFQKIEFLEGSFSSNLASVLAYYVYIILGLDFDSYSRYGGNDYFKKAQQIVNSAQGKAYSGWEAFTTKKSNRYWLVNQLLDNTYSPIRDAYYDYHRLGLDKMTTEPEAARNKIFECLDKLKKIHREEPNSFVLQIFLQTKRDEIINIFSEATQTEKENLITLMKEIDAAKASDYSEKLK